MHDLPTSLSSRLLKLAAYTILACLAPFSALADIRCATVNIDKVFNNYNEAYQQRETLLAKQKEYTQRLATLTSRRTKVSESMSDLRNEIKLHTESEEDKEVYRDQAQKLHDQYKSLEQAIAELENLHLKQSKKDLRLLLDTSLRKIHATVEQHAKDHQYHWVIDLSGRSNSTISPLIYAKDAEDITTDVLKTLNK
ncbi:MAG: OmpH family outer membrane protein [Akkermansiaceae bacterium]|nr:OmpH family outer membrane protein [Akkermansiaceae bacterium]